MAVLRMLPHRALFAVALCLACTEITAAQATEGAAASAEEAEPVYPIFDPEARLIGGVERSLEHPRAAQIGEHSRQPFFLEQARIELDFEADKWLSGSFSAELSDDRAVRDAFVNARIKRWLQVQAGHFKRPMSRIELTSTSKLPFRERGIFNRALLRDAEWGNRALGVMVWGKLRKPDLQWNLAVTNSAESIGKRRIEQIRGADVLGRVEYEPTEWLSIAINGGYKNTEPYLNGPNLSLLAAGGDVRIRAGGFRMVLDAIGAQNPRPPVPPDSRGRTPFALGLNGYATYDIPLGRRAALQPVVAGEWADTDLDLGEDETARGVGGLNVLLFDGAYRVMPQVEIVRPLGEVSARSQVKRETYYLLLTAELEAVTGRIIAFEGVDGAGKTTALALVARALRARGRDVFLPRTGKDHASRPVRAIREITRDRRNLALDPHAELLLYCAREAQVLAELVKPALARGALVLIDRSLLTAEVLGRARGLSDQACAAVARSASAELDPDLTIVFDVHPRTSRLRKQLAKIRAHSEERGGRKGLAGSAFKHRVRDNYGALAAERGYPVLHCERATPDELAERALRLIEHGAAVPLDETERDREPSWLIAGAGDFSAKLERVPDEIALLLGAGLMATRATRVRMAEREPALCAYALDADDPLRADLASREPAYALRGLPGKPLAGEGDLRVRLMTLAPAACVMALKHVASAHADVLRQRAADECPDEVLASLAGRGDARALELRERCAPRASDRALAIALEHVADEAAWSLRDALFERDPAYGLRSLRGVSDARGDALLWRYASQAPAAVLDALSGRDDAEAYRMRDALASCRQEVLESLRGLDDEAAWSWRERSVEQLPSNVAYSLLDVPWSTLAQAFAERCEAAAAGDLHVLRRVQALREQDAAPAWVKARRQRASTERDE